MSGKIAIINHEFNETATKLKQNHRDILKTYKEVTKLTEALVNSKGGLDSDKLRPKVTGLLDGVESDIISRLTNLFQQTEEVIKDYETVIKNVDTSC